MSYRVILLKNGEYKKTLHRCKTKETSYINYRRLIEENESVIFPRKYINYDGIHSVEYKICVSKITEDDDKFRTLKDKLGRTYTEAPLGDWTILTDNEYSLEETFWLYGKNPIHERVGIAEILPLLVKNTKDKDNIKQVIVVYNKLIFYNENEFEMIVCKCLKDAQRLHHALAKAAKDVGIKNIIFMGTASPASVSRMYDIIYENTDWTIEKIRRTSTRP
tara:strand:- start:100315 stop:100974 length:660 start_codon:yes stop_codon:yes gene_type:complete